MVKTTDNPKRRAISGTDRPEEQVVKGVQRTRKLEKCGK